MSFLKDIENKIGATSDLAYQQLEFYWGKEMVLWRPSKNDIHSEVFGKEANNALEKVGEFVGITQIDDMSTSDGYRQASFSEGFLITQYKDIKVGDVISYEGDGGFVKWKVEKHLDIGYTTTMFEKFSLSNMN